MSADHQSRSFLFDTHVHTSEVSACGHIEGRDLARQYKDAGYDGIVITDHFTSRLPKLFRCRSWADCVESYLSGYREAVDEGRNIGLNVLWGCEITFDSGPAGDFLTYGADEEFLLSNPDILSMDLFEFRDLIEGNDFLIYQAHPFRTGHVLAPPELLDGIEVINGNPRHFNDAEKAHKAAALHGLALLAGSDAHQHQDVGRAGIKLPRNPQSMKDFVAMLRNGETENIVFE
ncbi:MAG: PHP domain-containing protein [Spirochaetales bacterium]|jgi:predicted metal-dependent phosphoesterase TrpH|nr:PHP domain-containing protein [Spirochaetales bacterium]